MALYDTQALRAFVAVAENQSFSIAATQLNLTQPAVSKRIALLEEQIGKPLFDRIRKRIFLTEAGEILLPQAQSLLQQITHVHTQLQNMDGEISGNLSIAFSHHIGLHRLPPFLKAFKQHYPQVKLDIRFVDSEQAYDLILRGEIELAVITLTPNANKEINSEKLWQDPLCFVCSPEHELHLQDNVTLQILAQHEAILPASDSYTGNLIHELFKQQNLEVDVSMATNYLETIKMMVSVGLGWSVLPKTMTKSLEIVHTPDIYIERELGIIQYKDRMLSNAAIRFKELLNK
jgi:DNA-binding transcriptional LysR family regulator